MRRKTEQVDSKMDTALLNVALSFKYVFTVIGEVVNCGTVSKYAVARATRD
jgi:hypothetical protein